MSCIAGTAQQHPVGTAKGAVVAPAGHQGKAQSASVGSVPGVDIRREDMMNWGPAVRTFG